MEGKTGERSSSLPSLTQLMNGARSPMLLLTQTPYPHPQPALGFSQCVQPRTQDPVLRADARMGGETCLGAWASLGASRRPGKMGGDPLGAESFVEVMCPSVFLCFPSLEKLETWGYR